MNKLLIIILFFATLSCSVFSQEVVSYTFYGESHNGERIPKQIAEKRTLYIGESYRLIPSDVTHLTVLGEIPYNAFNFMIECLPNLIYLNLSQALFVPKYKIVQESKDYYIASYSSYFDPEKNVIPANAFYIPANQYMRERSHKNLQKVIFPESLSGIGDNAFCNTKIDSIIIPSGVTRIGKGVFSGCKNLKYISLPEGLKSIEESAFALTDIDSIVIPSGVKNIATGAFAGCHNLKYISLPDSLKSIGASAFAGCKSLSSIKIPKQANIVVEECAFIRCSALTEILNSHNIISIGPSAFGGCENLRSFFFNDTISKIRTRTFINCKSLHSIILPDSLRVIMYRAFKGCSALTDIELPQNINKIEERVFSNCTALASIELPNNIREIGIESFANCTALTKIILPDSLEIMGGLAFENCTALTELKLPQNLKRFVMGDNSGYRKFAKPYGLISKCPDLSISIDERNHFFSVKNGVLFNKEGTKLRGFLKPIKDTYKIPSSVKTISNIAFRGMENLTSVFMSNVDSIGIESFAYCTSLSYISISSSVKSIGGYAFSYCTGLKKISVYWIEPELVSINNSNYLFFCSDLNDCILEVPYGTKDKYLAHPVWKNFNIVEREQTTSKTKINNNNK